MAKAKWIKTQYPGVFKYETKKGVKYGIRVRYQDANSKWLEKSESGFDTIRTARNRKTDLESTVNQGEASSFEGDKTTFKEWFEFYSETKSLSWSPDTKYQVTNIYDNHLCEFDNIVLSKITLARYQSFINKRLHKENLALTTVENYHRHFMGIINMAVDHGILTKNKLKKVKISKDYKATDKYIESQNLGQFDQLAKETYNPIEYAMYILLRIGWRRGEVLGFTTSACKVIDAETIDVTVMQARTAVAKDGTTPKTQSSYRTNRLKGEMAKAILAAMDHSKQICKERATISPFVFVTDRGTPISTSTFIRRVDGVAKKVGIKVTPHMFRHTFASEAIANGMSPVEVAQWLGHSDVKMTLNKYSHSTRQSLDHIVNFASNL